MNEIKNPKFFSGGRAVFTVSNSTGIHYTFRIGHSKPEQPLFVGLLTGPQNDSDYTYLGVFKPEINEVRLTKASKYTPDSIPVKVINWAVKVVASQKSLPVGYSIQHAGKCCRCGRTLTTSESINRGWGPECDKYMS